MEKTYSLDSLLEEFSSYEVKEKRRTEFTSRLYITDLKILLPCEIYENYENLVKAIDKRINSLDEWSKDKPNTKNRKITSANTFLNFLEKIRKIKKAPHFKRKRIKREQLNTITEEKFTKLIDTIPCFNYKNARDRVIFSLIFFSGIKESEAANLGYKNFRSENGITYLNVGEGYKKRELEIPEQVIKEIGNYKELYIKAAKLKNLPSLESDTFFKNKFGKKISARSIRRKLEKWAKKAKIEANPQILRHSYAKRQLEKDTGTKELAELLGIQRGYASELEKLLA